MATVLAYTSPALGQLFPITALLTELHARGHRVAVRTVSTGVHIARGRGFEARPIDPRIEAIVGEDCRAALDPAAATAPSRTAARAGAGAPARPTHGAHGSHPVALTV
jgi:hypothetical protein